MSEWKRNKRRTDGFPKDLLGKKVEARHRDGQIFTGVVGEHPYLGSRSFNTADGMGGDVMSYRIVSEPDAATAANTPDYSKGFPVGSTAKDIGAKVGDEFVHAGDGEKYALYKDDGSKCPAFTDSNGRNWYISWHSLAPIPPKTAIELQAEEAGIPEPVQLADDAKPDADGWIEWKGGECPVAYDAIAEVKFRNGHTNTNPADVWRWEDRTGSWSIIAYRIHQEWPEDRMDIVGQNGNDGLHYDDTHLGIKRPDGDGWVKYNAGDVVNLDGVVSIDWVNAQCLAHTARSPRDLMWNDGSSTHQNAWYRLNYGDTSQHSASEQQADEADKRIDYYVQGVREAFGSAMPANKYQRTIKGVTVDVYDVLAAFGVTCQARGHAIKKLLMAGQRGHKDEAQDLREAVQAIERSIELVGK